MITGLGSRDGHRAGAGRQQYPAQAADTARVQSAAGREQGAAVSCVRIGMVGAGYIAGRHVWSLQPIGGVRVVAVADPLLQRARQLAGQIAGGVYADRRAMLDAEPAGATDGV